MRAEHQALTFVRGDVSVHLNLGDAPLDIGATGTVLFGREWIDASGCLAGNRAAIVRTSRDQEPH